MSTILDALRKVQTERRPRNLRESVLAGGSGVAAPAPSRRWLWLALAVLLLLVLPAAGAWFVWPGGEQLMAALPELPFGASADVQPEPTQTAQAEAQPPPQPPPRAPREARRVDRKAVRAAAAQKLPSVGPQHASEARAAVPEAAAPPPPRAVVAARPTPAPPPPEPEPLAPRREVDVSLRLERLPSAELERVDRDSDPFGGGGVHEVSFPDLSVETVRWHPEPERRVARILLDGTRPIEAREGDIIAGVAIQRIDPGAVEMRLGDIRARLKPGP